MRGADTASIGGKTLLLRIARCINSSIEDIFIWNFNHIRDKKPYMPIANPEAISTGRRQIKYLQEE